MTRKTLKHYNLSEICKLTYSKEDSFYSLLDSINAQFFRHTVQNIEYYYSPTVKTVAITGTNDPLDWFYNLNGFKKLSNISGTSSHKALIYEGFSSQFDLLIADMVSKGLEVKIATGHSLGGVLASLFHYHLENYEEIVTFGCPQFLRDSQNLDNVSLNIFNYYLGSDVVSYVPPNHSRLGKNIKLLDFKLNPFASHSMSNYVKNLKKQDDLSFNPLS